MIGRAMQGAMQGAMRGAWQGLRQALREGESGWEVVSAAGAHPFAGLGRKSKAARRSRPRPRRSRAGRASI
ncbi:hypothetical protein BV392_07025 [Rhodovulum sulfidophilum]|nr:hypothetical protein BV392_07025 [Rhodovulum sulfidophilum]